MSKHDAVVVAVLMAGIGAASWPIVNYVVDKLLERENRKKGEQ